MKKEKDDWSLLWEIIDDNWENENEEIRDVFAEMLIDRETSTHDGARRTISFFAKLLRHGKLPARGQVYLADVLDKVLGGKTFLPRKVSQSGPSDIDVLVAFEKNHAKGIEREDNYENLFNRFPGIKSRDTVTKQRSYARQQLRSLVKECVAAGASRDKAIKFIADRFGLPPAVVRNIISKR